MLSFSSRERFAVGLVTLALVLSCALPGSVAAGVAGKVRGTIWDEARKPLPGLLVQLAARNESATLRITGTDEKGRYQFRDLPAGVYDVQIAVEGYGDQIKGDIEVRPPFQNIVDFRLVAGDSADAAGIVPPPAPLHAPVGRGL